MSKKGIKGIISFIVLAVVWQILCTAFSVNTALVPTPVQVIKALVQLIKEGLPGSLSRVTLVGHIGISLYRFVIGYVTAAVIAIILGLILGTYEKAFDFVNPIVQVIRPIAPVAFLPFIVLWFGIGNLPAIVIIFIAAFSPMPSIDENGILILPSSGKNLKESDFIKSTGKNSIPRARHS